MLRACTSCWPCTNACPWDLVKQTCFILLSRMSMHALLQIWVKPSAEMQYMYGNHVLKSGLGRITENTPAYTGVVIYSMSDIPLGFGVTAKSTADCRKMDPSGIVVFHQADVGEALRPFLLSTSSCVPSPSQRCWGQAVSCCRWISQVWGGDIVESYLLCLQMLMLSLSAVPNESVQ